MRQRRTTLLTLAVILAAPALAAPTCATPQTQSEKVIVDGQFEPKVGTSTPIGEIPGTAYVVNGSGIWRGTPHLQGDVARSVPLPERYSFEWAHNDWAAACPSVSGISSGADADVWVSTAFHDPTFSYPAFASWGLTITPDAQFLNVFRSGDLGSINGSDSGFAVHAALRTRLDAAFAERVGS
jgi:hypothetical protein